MTVIDQPRLDVLEAIRIASEAMTGGDHTWTRKEQSCIKHGISFLMQAIGELEVIEIGSAKPVDTWSTLTDKESK